MHDTCCSVPSSCYEALPAPVFPQDPHCRPYWQLTYGDHTVCVLQMMLGSSPKVAVQDPSYPVYVDTSVIMGMTGDYNHDNTNFSNVQYMPCTPDNGFFPDISAVCPS